MIAMSLPPQQKPNAKRTGKRITFFNDQGSAMKEVTQHAEGPYYGMGAPPSEQGRPEPVGVESSSAEGPHMYLNSVIFSPEKNEQNRSHYQQPMPMKWPHPEQPQQRSTTWSQGAPMTTWTQSFGTYLGTQVSFPKQLPEGMVIPQVQQQPPSIRMGEKQQQAPNAAGEAFREPAKTNRNMDWAEQQQQQAFQQTHKTGILNPQQHVTSTAGNTSVLQPFQLAFGQPKQNLTAGYYQVFQSNRTLPNLNYGAQANSQHQMQQLQQHEQQMQMQRLMLQKQQLQQQHMQQQALPHQPQPPQQQVQTQVHQLSQLQQPSQQMQLQQHVQQQVQQAPSQKMKSEPLQKLQQNQQVVEQYSGGQQTHVPEKSNLQVVGQSQVIPEPPPSQDLAPQHAAAVPQQTAETQQPGPRRSRRLSREGGGPPSENPFLVAADQQVQDSQNGAPDAGEPAAKQDIRAAPTGVIQSTRRKRRVSQEVNLETLAQKASEMESLPSHTVKELLRPWSPSAPGPGRGAGDPDASAPKRTREESLVPLVIPVSVPVRQADPSLPDPERCALSASWPLRSTGPGEPGRPDHKPSVIVTRRRSLRNSLSESSGQNGGTDGGESEGKVAKSKRRPRPEPLFIPPPKLGTFIAPAVYSSITPYQSHLRSPVRLLENPLTLPPYTPPPILSPVREGSGLYFSAILSAAAAAAAAGPQGLPPPATPKSAARSLLRSNSTEITPPVLSAMGEATPVSIEPRINIGQRYQAEVPELRDRSGVLLDPHKAELVWAPLAEINAGGPPQQKRVDDLMHLACSSALCGGGTNQELAMHCLYECKGDIMEALGLLLLKTPIFPKPHPLADYHYSGSDSWTPEERRIFNKGIGTYKKDFFMVQKMVSSKTVAQCVEFYYTYKKQVKMGRNGTVTYGEAEAPEPRHMEEEVDYKGSQRFDLRKEDEHDRKWEGSGDRKHESSPGRVTLSLQATESAGAVLVLRNQDDGKRDQPVFGMSHAQTAPPKPRPVWKSGAGAKGPVGQEGEFPCKKCGRVFYKVKSRSAHMKSHAEQEKKAAALRQREAEERAEEERAAAAAAAMLAAQQNGARAEQAPVRRVSSEDSSEDDDEDVEDEDWH